MCSLNGSCNEAMVVAGETSSQSDEEQQMADFNVEAAIKEESRRWAVVQSWFEKRAEAEAAATATAGKQHFATLLSKAGLLPAASMEASTIVSPPSVSPLSAKKGFNVEAAIKEEARRFVYIRCL